MDHVVSPETQHLLWLLGRALLGALFVAGGIRHCFALAPLTQAMAARGVPAPRLVLIAGTALQTVAGAALMLGLQTTLAVVCLIVFTLVASTMFLHFWSMKGADRVNAINAWWSNIGIIGGMLVVVAHTLRHGAA